MFFAFLSVAICESIAKSVMSVKMSLATAVMPRIVYAAVKIARPVK